MIFPRYSSNFKVYFWTLDLVFMIFRFFFVSNVRKKRHIGLPVRSCVLEGNNWLNAFYQLPLKCCDVKESRSKRVNVN